MNELFPHIPALLAMLILLMFSAFFSCSEAAFFSLSQSDRNALAQKGKLGKLAFSLSTHPEKLLNSILLGNLFVNLLFFTISTLTTFQLNKQSQLAWGLGVGSLLIIIIFGEVLPKNLGVTAPHFFALTASVPLSLLVRLLQPLLPILSHMNILSRRLFCPKFEQEPYLMVGDLERAVVLSGNDAALLKREQRSLQNIVSLSDMEAAELMRPRSWIKMFRPPMTFDQVLTELGGILPRSGYCLLTESDSDEIVSALCLNRLTADRLETNWEGQFQDVFYVPWSASVADVFDRMQQTRQQVAVVVNEFGETMGIITTDDIISVIFTREPGRSRELLDRRELKMIDDHCWKLTGLTSLRILERKFNISFHPYSSLTVGGLLREILERFPQKGDQCTVESLLFHVTEVNEDYDLTVHLTVNSGRGVSHAEHEMLPLLGGDREC